MTGEAAIPPSQVPQVRLQRRHPRLRPSPPRPAAKDGGPRNLALARRSAGAPAAHARILPARAAPGGGGLHRRELLDQPCLLSPQRLDLGLDAGLVGLGREALSALEASDL